MSVFPLSSGFGALSAVLDAARLQSVTQSAGSRYVLLNAIAAEVTGGLACSMYAVASGRPTRGVGAPIHRPTEAVRWPSHRRSS